MMAGRERRWLRRRVFRVAFVVAFLLACVTGGGVAGYLTSRALDPVFAASATFLVGDLKVAVLTDDDIQTSDRLTSTYGTLVRTRGVLDPVVDRLGLDTSWLELKDRVHVDLAMNEIPLMDVVVYAGSATQAQRTAAAIVDRVLELGRPATDPGAVAPEVVAEQMRRTQGAITRAEARLSMLVARLASVSTPVMQSKLQARLENQSSLIARLQDSYRIDLLTDRSSANALHLLQAPEAEGSPLRPKSLVETVSGALAGGLAGLVVAWLLAAGTRRRRAGGHESRRVEGAADPWVVELSATRP
ncbi:MAG: hypothetical protein WEE66_10180 [Actinomycetota bacterium]